MIKCEVCDEPNLSAVLHPRYTFVCFDCVEEGQAMEDPDGNLRAIMECSCGRLGAINYDDGSFKGYFCGSTPWCTP